MWSESEGMFHSFILFIEQYSTFLSVFPLNDNTGLGLLYQHYFTLFPI